MFKRIKSNGFVTTRFNIKQFLGAFRKLRKVTVGFIMSVRLSACNNSAPTERIFMKFVV
jgi:hypothetical protein